MAVEIVRLIGEASGDRYVLEADGLYEVGGDLSPPAAGEDGPGQARPFSLELTRGYCVFRHTTKNGTALNGRPVLRDALLVHGDRIQAGANSFALSMANAGDYPMARIDDTFWVVRQMAEGWQLAQPIGLLRRHSDEFVENLCMRQDQIGDHRDVAAYAASQFSAVDRVVRALQAVTLGEPRPFGCEEGLHARLSFKYDGKSIVQHQFYGRKGEDVCIAVWARPPQNGSEGEEAETFRALLAHAHFS
jgi:hypothetical protein